MQVWYVRGKECGRVSLEEYRRVLPRLERQERSADRVLSLGLILLFIGLVGAILVR